MGKNILVVRGGGRPRGNTAQLAESFAKGAVESGHNVELISLANTMWEAVWAATPVGTASHVCKRTGS